MVPPSSMWCSAKPVHTVGVTSTGALASRSRGKALRGAVLAYVEAIRNTPLLAQLFFIYFGLPAIGLRLDALPAALLTLVINLGAYSTEIVRAGIAAVPHGQLDAGAALGLTRWQVMRLIVLKPALKIVFRPSPANSPS